MKPTYYEILQNLNNRVLMPKSAPGLEKTQAGLDRLQLFFPQNSKRSILVAGTNGKGSICRTLEHFILATGQSTLLFTSPHLVDVRERIRIDGRNISECQFATAFLTVDESTRDLDLSHFETLTLMAAWLAFSQNPPDDRWFIWEVGLGGTWDSTNAIPHGTAVFSQIGYDHQDLLGDSLESIAENKLGILRDHQIVVVPYQWPDAAKQQLTNHPFRPHLQVWVSEPATLEQQSGAPLGQFTLTYKAQYVQLPGAGQRFGENFMVALKALEALEIPTTPGLTQVDELYWPGRGDVIESVKLPAPIMLSGDHNPQGVETLLEILKTASFRHIHLLVGIGINKPADNMLKLFLQIENSTLILCQSPFKGCGAKEFKQWIDQGILFIPDPIEALKKVLCNVHRDDLVVVTGSLYLVGEIYKKAITEEWLNQKQLRFFTEL